MNLVSIVTIALSILLFIGAVCIAAYLKYKYAKPQFEVSFREAIDLLNVPVITFMHNGLKLHFLLDTGSSHSHIDKSILDSLKIDKVRKGSVTIITGNQDTYANTQISMKLTYDNFSFEEEFFVGDFKKAFDDVFTCKGVEVVGILGSDFFKKYEHIIDFQKLRIYKK